MNTYLDLATFKSSGVMNLTGTSEDTRLRLLLEAVSRSVDLCADRHFYAFTQAMKFDGNAKQELRIQDLIAATAVKTDDNKDRTFETTWASTDYLLLPANADPTTAGNSGSRPYTRILVDTDAGAKSDWPKGVQTVEITGRWGFWEHTQDTGTDVNDVDVTASDTTLTVDDGTTLNIGDTLLIDSEQMYVTSIATHVITVTRGVNGTTAATHADDSDVSRYLYPEGVREAVLLEASRLWQGRTARYSAQVGTRRAGSVQEIAAGFDKLTMAMLSPFERMSV